MSVETASAVFLDKTAGLSDMRWRAKGTVMMQFKTKFKPGDIAAGLLIFSLAAGIYLAGLEREGPLEAEIRQDGLLTRRISLSGLREPVRIELEQEDGRRNVILAEDGRICIAEASCPHQDCVRTGWLDKSGQSAFCLENRVSVVVVSQNETGPDAIAR